MGARCQGLKGSRSRQKMALLTSYWIPELLPSFVFCENQIFTNILNQVGPGGLPPGEAVTGEERWQLGSTWEGRHLPQFSGLSCGVRGGGSKEKKERKKWTYVIRVHRSISCIVTAPSSKLHSPRWGPWHLLLVKTMHRVWGFVSLCLLFFSNSRIKCLCWYTVYLIYCICHSICLGKIRLNLEKSQQSKSKWIQSDVCCCW